MPRVSNSRVISTNQQAPFTGGENLYNVAYTFTDTKLDVDFFYTGTTTPIVAYTFTDTKLDVEFFTKGTTTPVSSFTRVQQLQTHYVFWGLKY